MNKQEFLAQLRKGLAGLPQDDVEERITFYSEMIEDRMEEGLSEEKAVSAIGSVEEVVAQVVAETPLTKIAKERIRPKRQLRAWEIVLLVLGSPIWLSLLIAAAAVIFSLYVVVWSVLLSLWAVFGTLVGTAAGSILAGIGFACGGHGLSGVAMLAAGMVCAGISIFTFYGCKAAAKGIVSLTKKSVLWMKGLLSKKEEA